MFKLCRSWKFSSSRLPFGRGGEQWDVALVQYMEVKMLSDIIGQNLGCTRP